MINLEDELAPAGSQQHLDTLETQLLALQKNALDANPEGVKRAFRALHAIKGEARSFDLINIGDLAAQMEHALAPIRFHRMPPTERRVSALLSATDRLHQLIQSPGTSNQSDIAETIASLAGLPADDATESSATASLWRLSYRR